MSRFSYGFIDDSDETYPARKNKHYTLRTLASFKGDESVTPANEPHKVPPLEIQELLFKSFFQYDFWELDNFEDKAYVQHAYFSTSPEHDYSI